MKRHILICLLLASWLIIAAGGAPALAQEGGTPAAQPAAPALPDGVFVVRIYYNTVEDSKLLTDFDLFEYNNQKEHYFLAAVDRAGLKRLEGLGFRAVLDPEETTNFARLSTPWAEAPDTIPGYGCYRTVEDTFAAAQALVTSHPTLAAWSDVGNSWEKSVGQLDGYDMMVLKLTNSAITGDKPDLFITAAIHAREYTTAETATRFAEYLVNNYGVNADATWILDHHEIHLMLQANPDGRKEAEGGVEWRKNTNENYCGATSSSRGADLNRNYTFKWGCCGGSSGSQCNETYRGPTAASEPETQAAQNYMAAIFPVQRGTGDNDPAPLNATGIYIDLHSFSELVLWPWGWTSTLSPNATQLQTLGRKMAYFNNYTPQKSYSLYATDGTTDDHAYGVYGVAAYCIEMGTAFFQDCATFESTIYPNNLQTLIYTAKVVRTPYMTPLGPDALNVTTSPVTVTLGSPATLTATINDTRFNNSQGSEPTQAIAAAEYYIDTPPWQAGAVARAMTAVDGSFNSTIENVTATVNTTGLALGRHLLFVRGRDANNNWGAFSAAFLDVTIMSTTPAAQAVCAPDSAVYTVNVGYPGTVTLSAAGNPAGTTASFSVNPVAGPGSSTLTIGNTGAGAAGSYTISVTGAAGSATEVNSVQLDLAAGAPAGPALVSPANAATGVSTTPTFSWNAVAGVSSYAIEVATDPTFTTIVASASGLTGTSYTPATALNTNTRYNWRVMAVSACGKGGFAAIFHFTTAAVAGECSAGYAANVLLRQGFEAGAGGWTHSATTGADTWTLWGTNVHSGSAAFHATDPTTQSDQRLVSTAVALPSGQAPLTLRFWNRQVMENRTNGCYDGGILEVSTNSGSTWTQVTTGLLTDPYDGPF